MDADSSFDSLSYVPLTPATENKKIPTSNNREEFNEVEFNYQVPYSQAQGLGIDGDYGDNDLVSVPLQDYNTFLIKICFFSLSSSVVPRVKDLRTVALSGTTVVGYDGESGNGNQSNGSSGGPSGGGYWWIFQ